MRYSNMMALAILGLSTLACAKQESQAADTSKVAGGTTSTPAAASKLGETNDMKTPESVRYDPDLDVFYVSNINGNPFQHDGNGFIAVVRADSTGAPIRILVEGGKNGATLDAPTGLALAGDTLWVADLDHVRAFNRRTGAPIAEIDLTSQKATFLNDVAVGGDGSVYITDTGLTLDAKGAMAHTGVDRIFKIAGGKAAELRVDSLDAPNGITWDKANGRFIVAPSNSTGVKTWREGDKATATLISGPGQYDGVEVLADGRLLVTSWADSAVHVLQNGTLSTMVSGVNGPADIGVDTKRNVLAIPRLADNKVEYYKIP